MGNERENVPYLCTRLTISKDLDRARNNRNNSGMLVNLTGLASGRRRKRHGNSLFYHPVTREDVGIVG